MESEKKKRNERSKQKREELPRDALGDAEYDARLDDDAKVRPTMPGGLLDKWGVKKIKVNPDDVD